MDNDNKFEVYDTIQLPNGGLIQMDGDAYKTYQGGCVSTHKKGNSTSWKYTIDFEAKDVDTASLDKKNIELR